MTKKSTSKAVATELKNYTKTAELEENISKSMGLILVKMKRRRNKAEKTFGSNVGIDTIKPVKLTRATLN